MSSEQPLPQGFNTGAFLRLAVPMIISRAGLAAMGMADKMMVARYQSRELAVLSLADGTMGRLLDVVIAFLLGGLVLSARHYGRGDHTGARHIWLRTNPVSLIVGALLFLFSLTGAWILPALGQQAELATEAAPIMSILGAGYPFALVALAAAVYLEGINRPKFVAISVATANILNIILNWFFISGHAGFPAMGARGSALSTTLVRIALCVALFAHAWRATSGDDSTDDHHAERKASRRAQWRLGWGSALTTAAMVALSGPLTLLAGRRGFLSLATFSAAWNIAGPAMLIALGMADAAGIFVSSEAGRSGVLGASKISWAALRLTLVPVSTALLLLVIWPLAFAGIYTRDANLKTSMAAVLPLVAAVIWVDTVGFNMVSSLRALRESAWPSGIEIGSMLLLLPVAFHLGIQRELGVAGLFIAMLVSGTVRAISLTCRFAWLTHPSAQPSPTVKPELRLHVD